MSFSKENGASVEQLGCHCADGSHPYGPDAGSAYSRPTNPNEEPSPADQVHGVAGAFFPFSGQDMTCMSGQAGGVFPESLSHYSDDHYPSHGVSNHFTPLFQTVAPGAPDSAPWYYNDGMTPNAPLGVPRSGYPDNMLPQHEEIPSTLELIQRHPKSFFHDAASFNSASSESDISPKHSEAEINPYLPAPAISPSQQQTHGSPQELVWDPRSNKQAPVGPLKRPRTQEERSITRQIRNRGGACTSCRKNRRRCHPDHPPAGSRKSKLSPNPSGPKPRLHASSSTSSHHNAIPSSSNSSNGPNSPSGSSFSPAQGGISPNEDHSTHVPHEAATVGLGEQFAAPMPLPAFSLYTELNFDGYAEQDDLVWQNSLIEGIL